MLCGCRESWRRRLPKHTGLVFLTEVAFSCKPFDLLMSLGISGTIDAPTLWRFQQILILINLWSRWLGGGNELCYKVRPSPSFVSFLNFFGSEFNFYLSLDLKILQRFSSKVSPFDKRFGSVPWGLPSLYQHFIRRWHRKKVDLKCLVFFTLFSFNCC